MSSPGIFCSWLFCVPCEEQGEKEENYEMLRRDFLKGVAFTALAAGLLKRIPLGAAVKKDEKCDLAAVRGGSPGDMFDLAIAELGGMGAFVRKGQKVVVKPNIGWNSLPEEGADTNPELVGRIVKRALEAGAAKVIVFDHTCDADWVSCYKRSGIRDAVEKAGGVMVTGNDKSVYREVEIPGAKVMKKALVHPALLDADVVINVPVLKNHGGATMTCAMKNYMGVVWDRRWMHKNKLEQTIADSVLIRKPDLNVVDASLVMTHGGPTGRSARSRRVRMDSLLASRDILAIDTAAVKMLGVTMPPNRNYLEKAAELQLGERDLKKLKIKRIVTSKRKS